MCNIDGEWKKYGSDIGTVILTGQKGRTRTEKCPNLIFTMTNFRYLGLGLNPCLPGEKSTSSCFFVTLNNVLNDYLQTWTNTDTQFLGTCSCDCECQGLHGKLIHTRIITRFFVSSEIQAVSVDSLQLFTNDRRLTLRTKVNRQKKNTARVWTFAGKHKLVS
jgi:hypothetical protein